jgi:hypothetical protein
MRARYSLLDIAQPAMLLGRATTLRAAVARSARTPVAAAFQAAGNGKLVAARTGQPCPAGREMAR